MNKITSTLTALMLLLSLTASAQSENKQIVNTLAVEGRIGYNYSYFNNSEGGISNDATGFRGDYVYLMMGGNISKNVSYFYRQRLDKVGSLPFFDATEILNLTWNATDRLHIAGGKQVVALGSFEYNTAPIDLYSKSEFWWTYSPYELGVSVDYDITKNDNLLLQLNNSSFRYTSGNNTYGVNLLWTGKHGFYESLWSVNMTQYKVSENSDTKSYWANYIILGNKFNFTDDMSLSVDLVNRATTNDYKFFNDYSVMAEFSARPVKQLRCFAKYTRDYNKDNTHDLAVVAGKEINQGSLGVEYEPLKDNSLRLFATGAYTWGDATGTSRGTIEGDQILAEVGVKFTLDALKGIKALLK